MPNNLIEAKIKLEEVITKKISDYGRESSRSEISAIRELSSESMELFLNKAAEIITQINSEIDTLDKLTLKMQEFSRQQNVNNQTRGIDYTPDIPGLANKIHNVGNLIVLRDALLEQVNFLTNNNSPSNSNTNVTKLRALIRGQGISEKDSAKFIEVIQKQKDTSIEHFIHGFSIFSKSQAAEQVRFRIANPERSNDTSKLKSTKK